MSSRRPRILLGVSGSVAAVKWEELVTLLLPWSDVRVIHTAASLHFASLAPAYAPAASAAWRAALDTAGSASARAAAAAGATAAGADASLPPAESPLGLVADAAEWRTYGRVGADAVVHIELRAWADALLIAPASAHTLAKLAGGLADNLLTCVARAWPFADGVVAKPLLIAPAMNDAMWAHPATAEHTAKLKSWGVRVVEPVEKKLACGDTGVGGLAAVADIVRALRDALGVADVV
jgi:phosphopantothenoylcysteine decarboxylase